MTSKPSNPSRFSFLTPTTSSHATSIRNPFSSSTNERIESESDPMSEVRLDLLLANRLKASVRNPRVEAKRIREEETMRVPGVA